MRAYAFASIRGLALQKRKREQRFLRESACVGEDGESYFEVFLPKVGANQEACFDAKFWASCISDLPDWHRDTMVVLADGGSPIDLCRSGALRPADAMTATRQARGHVHESAARKRLERARWPKGPLCPECGCSTPRWIRDRRRYDCRHCRHQFSVTSKTPLAYNKLPFQVISRAVDLIRDGASASELQRQLQVQYMTAHALYGAILETKWLAHLAGQPLVAQPDRAPGSEPEGRRFESSRAGPPRPKPEPKPVSKPRRRKTEIVVTSIGDWRHEDVELLRQQWAVGMSGTEIAANLGRTRSAVLGKINRLGLAREAA
jgi:transposase-like protein